MAATATIPLTAKVKIQSSTVARVTIRLKIAAQKFLSSVETAMIPLEILGMAQTFLLTAARVMILFPTTPITSHSFIAAVMIRLQVSEIIPRSKSRRELLIPSSNLTAPIYSSASGKIKSRSKRLIPSKLLMSSTRAAMLSNTALKSAAQMTSMIFTTGEIIQPSSAVIMLTLSIMTAARTFQ